MRELLGNVLSFLRKAVSFLRSLTPEDPTDFVIKITSDSAPVVSFDAKPMPNLSERLARPNRLHRAISLCTLGGERILFLPKHTIGYLLLGFPINAHVYDPKIGRKYRYPVIAHIPDPNLGATSAMLLAA